jgi:hypothetical protein
MGVDGGRLNVWHVRPIDNVVAALDDTQFRRPTLWLHRSLGRYHHSGFYVNLPNLLDECRQAHSLSHAPVSPCRSTVHAQAGDMSKYVVPLNNKAHPAAGGEAAREKVSRGFVSIVLLFPNCRSPLTRPWKNL